MQKDEHRTDEPIDLDETHDRDGTPIGRRKNKALGPIGLLAAGVLALGGKVVKPLLGAADDAAGVVTRHADEAGHLLDDAGHLADDASHLLRNADEAERALRFGTDELADVAGEVATQGVEYAVDSSDDEDDQD